MKLSKKQIELIIHSIRVHNQEILRHENEFNKEGAEKLYDKNMEIMRLLQGEINKFN
jgi:hypothetical protein